MDTVYFLVLSLARVEKFSRLPSQKSMDFRSLDQLLLIIKHLNSNSILLGINSVLGIGGYSSVAFLVNIFDSMTFGMYIF